MAGPLALPKELGRGAGWPQQVLNDREDVCSKIGDRCFVLVLVFFLKFDPVLPSKKGKRMEKSRYRVINTPC